MKLYWLLLICTLTIYGKCYSQKQNILENVIVVKLKNSPQLKSNANTVKRSLNYEISEFNAVSNPMFPQHNTQKNASTQSEISRIYTITLNDANDHASCLKKMNALPYIEYAEPYYIPHLLDTVNDPLVNGQYYIPLTKAFEAFDLCKGDSNIVIGIIDTGIDMDHEDLVDNIKINYADPINGIDDDNDGYIDNYRGWDVADNDANPECTDSTYHGVLVAGIAAATTNNSLGISATAYRCKFMPIKAANNRGWLVASYQSIVYAADHGCQIINCSWGDTIKSLLAQDVIDYAVNEKGCVVVAAAGNARNNTPYYPASLDGVISVGGTDRYDRKWDGSTFGIELDLCAPGLDIYTTMYNNTYKGGTRGTSFAAPQVAGAAALLMAHNPKLNNRQIAEKLRVTTDIIDTVYENQYYYRQLGSGRLNTFKALNDTILPGLRIVEQSLKTTNANYKLGDTINNIISITNFLEKAQNTSILLSDNSDFTSITTDLIQLGDINTWDTLNNQAKPFRIYLHEDMPYDHEFKLCYDFAGKDFSDYQQFKIIANTSYINVHPNQIATTFTSNGNIGYSNRDKKYGSGFIYNNLNLLYNGGIIIGKSNKEIVSSMDIQKGFVIEKPADTISTINQFEGKAQFSPSPKKWAIDLSIKQNYIALLDKQHSGTIFTSYTLYNNEMSDIEDFRFSIFTDWDIYSSNANNANFDATLNLLYAYSYANTVAYAGVCFLSEGNINAYCFDMVEGGNGGLDITQDFSDDKKWYAMTNPRENAGNNSYNMDIASMLTCGPYIINSDDSITLHFALIAASNLEDLKEKARAAKLAFNGSNSVDIKPIQAAVFPNPTTDIINIEFDANQLNYIKLYDSKGTLLYQSEKNTPISTKHLKGGVYFLSIETQTKKYTYKVMVTH